MANNIRVLIIDDEELVRRNLRLFIESNGMSVLEAVDGRAGMEMFEKELPEVVVTDLRMPVMDGFGVIEIMKTEFPQTPVIVVSNATDVHNALAALRMGAWDYIVKPISDADVLNAIIQRSLERSRLLTENKCYQTHLEQLVEENKNYQNHLEELVRERTQELRKLSQVATESPVSIIITDAQGNIEYANPKFVQTTGYSVDEVLGKNPRILKSGCTPPELYRDLWGTISSGEIWEGDLQNRKKNGDLFWEHILISAVKKPNGTLLSHNLI